MSVPDNVARWRPLAERFASAHPTLSANEILAIIWSESTGNPDAVNPADPSYGLMQVTMLIGRKFSNAQTPTDLMDPETNVQAGAGFLSYLKTNYGSRFPETWPIAYNEGEGNLLKGRTDNAYLIAFNSHMAELASI